MMLCPFLGLILCDILVNIYSNGIPHIPRKIVSWDRGLKVFFFRLSMLIQYNYCITLLLLQTIYKGYH
jgi:hypothetical protein